MSDPIVIEFLGEPVAKGRPRFASRGQGRPVAFTPAHTRKYEAALQYTAQQAMNGPILTGALSISIVVRLPFLQSWSMVQQKKARNGILLPTKKPDLDNFEKAIIDSLQGVVYLNDSQIVYKISSKIYSERPGIRIEVSQYRLIELEADRASVGEPLALPLT